MKWAVFVFLGLGLLFLAWFCAERVKGVSVKATIIKALTSAYFMIVAVSAFIESRPEKMAQFGLFVIVGLLFGLFGDIWLDLKFVYPDDNDIYTFAGFYTFAFQHILLIAGLLMNYAMFDSAKGAAFAILPIVLGLCAGALNVIFMEKPMKLNYGKFKVVSGVYGGLLISDTLLAGSLAILYSFKNMTLTLMFVGLILFLISDLILSGTYFGEGKNRPVDVITNHVSYYLGQFLIALSLLYLA
ncbi:MAG: hypothetical protein IJR10_06640 [Clostridia bacterium]|nr:hypothetical protein [Clostridia bacterium]